MASRIKATMITTACNCPAPAFLLLCGLCLAASGCGDSESSKSAVALSSAEPTQAVQGQLGSPDTIVANDSSTESEISQSGNKAHAEAANVVSNPEADENVKNSLGSQASEDGAASNERDVVEARQPNKNTKPLDGAEPAGLENTTNDKSRSDVIPGDAAQAIRLLNCLELSPYELNQISTHDELELDYTCNSDTKSAMQYHMDALQRAGWKLTETGGQYDAGNYSSRYLVKDGYFLQLAVIEFSKQLAGPSLRHLGNVDARSLPMVSGAELDERSTVWGAMYKVDLPVEEIASFCRRSMAELGWVEYKTTAMTSELPYESGGSRVIPFVQNGITCYLNISAPGFFSGSEASPSYFMTGLIAKGITVPAKAEEVELDRKSGTVAYKISLPLAEAVEQLNSQIVEHGWQDLPELKTLDVRSAQLVFKVDEQTVFMAEFSEKGYANTQVRILSFDASDLNAMLADRKQSSESSKVPAARSAEQTADSSKDVGDGAEEKILANKFPIPEGAEIAGLSEPLMITSKLAPVAIAKFYDRALAELGWKRSQDMSQEMADGMQMLVYQKQDAQINIFARKSSDDIPSIIVQGNGIQWPTEEELFAEEGFNADVGTIADRIGAVAENMAAEGEAFEDSGSEKAQIVSDQGMVAKAANTVEGKATLGSTSVKLDHGVTYQTISGGEIETFVLFTDRELPKQELLIQLSENSEISLFDLEGRIPQYIQVSWDGQFKSCNLNIAGASVSGIGDELDIDVKAEGGWIRGTISLEQPRDVFGDPFTFSVSFDLAALSPRDLTPEMLAEANRPLKDVDGLPVPAAAIESYREGSPYSTTAHAVLDAELAQVVELYRKEMPPLGWKEDEKSYREVQGSKRLKFENEVAEILVTAKSTDEGVELEIVRRDVAIAKENGMLPDEGKGKLLFGNAFDQEVVVTIGTKDYKLKAGLGAEDPKDALIYNVAPGKYVITVKVPGKPEHVETVQVQTGTTWGVLVLPTGEHLADRLY